MQADGNKRKKKVLLVDDHPVMREGIASVIEREPDLTVCGQAEDCEGALKAIADLDPDFAIVDICLKDGDGIRLVRDIRKRRPDLPVLILTMHGEAVYGERALQAGARGYVVKSEPARNIVDAVRLIMAGGIQVSERLREKMLRAHIEAEEPQAGSAANVLSDREFEVFRMLGQGQPVREIAAQLRLSVKTIETYQERMKKKLRLDSNTELHKCAIHDVQFQQTA